MIKGYIFTLAALAVISALAENIAPKEYKGHISLLCGAVLLVAIVAPLGGGGFGNIPSFKVPESVEPDSAALVRSVSDAMNETVASDAKKRIETEFGIGVEVVCRMKTAPGGEIEGVGEIELYGKGITDAVCKRMSAVYAPERIFVNGEPYKG